MIKAFFGSKKWFWWAYGVGILLIGLLALQTGISVWLNKEIYGPYGDLLQNAIQRGSAGLTEFWVLTLKWFIAICIYAGIGACTYLVAKFYAFYWRKAITYNYIPRRMRAPKIEGESQRIQEDPQIFADILESIGLQAVRALMLLIAFLPFLWKLSEKSNIKENIVLIKNIIHYASLSLPVSLGIFAILLLISLIYVKRKQSLPRFLKRIIITTGTITISLVSIVILEPLVWLAILLPIWGTGISWLVSIKLPKLELKNQVVEAAFRKELVLGEDDRINHAFPEELYKIFADVEYNYKRLFWHTMFLDLWSTWFDLVMAFLPSILIAPGIFTGLITLGMLTQIENAFMKVQNGFQLLMNNWKQITRLRSVWKRLHEFEANLDKYQFVLNKN